MKKVIVILILSFIGITTFYGQTSNWGVKVNGGINVSMGTDSKIGPIVDIGGTYRCLFPIKESSFGFLVQTDLYIGMMGGTTKGHLNHSTEPSGTLKYRMSYACIPVTAGIQFQINKMNSLSLRLGIFGMSALEGTMKVKKLDSDLFSYNGFDTSSSPIVKLKRPNGKSISYNKEFLTRFGFGSIIAMDYSINHHWQLSIEWRQQLNSLIRILGNKDVTPSDLTLGLGYFF